MDNFDLLPGSIYFMMVLEYQNLDISTEINSARDYFTNPALSNYPGQHVENLATTALKRIITIQKEYAPSLDLGSIIILIVYDTSFDDFNLQVFTHLCKALTLEQKYELLVPTFMIQDSEYSTYGPVGIYYLLHI